MVKFPLLPLFHGKPPWFPWSNPHVWCFKVSIEVSIEVARLELSDHPTTAARGNSPWALGEGYCRPQVRWAVMVVGQVNDLLVI